MAANRAKGNRHAELLAQLYSDPFRFLDEMLQNTEDALRRKAAAGEMERIQFRLYEDRLDILHNGVDFDEADLMAITTFAGSTKGPATPFNQIGKFGIGFRSVYAFTDHPEIHSGPWHFRIDDYEVLQETAASQPVQGFGTLIRLPFRVSETRKTFQCVREGLQQLDGLSLLFLTHLSSLEVYIKDKLHHRAEIQRQWLQKGMEIRRIHGTEGRVEPSEWLLLLDADQSVSIATALAFRLNSSSDSSLCIIRSKLPWLFTYFPTRQESHLNFLVHAPFTTTPTREAIPFDARVAPENIGFLQAAARLLNRSLIPLRNLGLMNASFYDVLPLSVSAELEMDPVIAVFHEVIVKALRQKNIVPAVDDQYAAAANLVAVSEPGLSALLDKNTLSSLFQRTACLNPNFQDYPETRRALLSVGGIREVDYKSLAFRLSVQPGFLEQQHWKWFLRFYPFMAAHTDLWDEWHSREHYSLRRKPFIRLKSGKNTVVFDEAGKRQLSLPATMRTRPGDVHPAFLSDEACMNFFRMLGLDKPLEADSQQLVMGGQGSGCHAEDSECASSLNTGLIGTSPEGHTDSGLAGILFAVPDFPDAFRTMLNEAMELASALLQQRFPAYIWTRARSGEALFSGAHRMESVVVYVACRAPQQHRFLLPLNDWMMMNAATSTTWLLLVSDAGTAEAAATLFEDPLPRIKKGHIICDPVGFNFLDDGPLGRR